jgi:hypothetical protein
MTQETLHDNTINSILLHPLEMQVHHSFAGVVVQLHWLAVWCSKSRGEQTVGWVLANIGKEVNLN